MKERSNQACLSVALIVMWPSPLKQVFSCMDLCSVKLCNNTAVRWKVNSRDPRDAASADRHAGGAIRVFSKHFEAKLQEIKFKVRVCEVQSNDKESCTQTGPSLSGAEKNERRTRRLNNYSN